MTTDEPRDTVQDVIAQHQSDKAIMAGILRIILGVLLIAAGLYLLVMYGLINQ